MTTTRQVRSYIETDGVRWPGCHLQRVTGRESIGELFTFTIEVAADLHVDLADTAVPGQRATLVFQREGRDVRRVHGAIVRVALRFEQEGERCVYRIELAPRAQQLALVEAQEVYLDRSVPDILRDKLELHGFTDDDFELRLGKSYPQRDFVVQYGETDLAFISRLAEDAGISLFVEQGETVDRLVFTDWVNGFGERSSSLPLAYVGQAEEEGVYDLEIETGLIPGSFYVRDYNYRNPLLEPLGVHHLEGETAGGVVDYGAHVRTPEEATALATIRAEERHCRKVVHRAVATSLELSAGLRIHIAHCPALDGSRPLLIERVEHDLAAAVDGPSEEPNFVYRARITAVAGDAPYRPVRRAPRPKMPAVVTGIVQPDPAGVVGGHAILSDDGRYWVQLHFDTYKEPLQKASAPIRMAQPFAGYGNGMHFPLVPGTEVLIAFANGDPDRPVILAAVPNRVSPSPVTAADSNQNRIRTNAGIVIEFGAVETPIT